MKSIIFSIALLAVLIPTFGQNVSDTIITKSSGKIPCYIVELNADTQSIIYSLTVVGELYSIPVSEVYQYHWEGELFLAEQVINRNQQRTNKTIINEVYDQPSLKPIVIKPTPGIEPTLTNSQKAGVQLMKFANGAQLGIAMEIAGGALIYASTQAKSEQKEAAMIVGAGVGIIGFFIHVFSYSNARNAGKLFKIGDKITVTPSQQGVGVAIPLK